MTKRMTILSVVTAMAVWGQADVQAAEIILIANQGALSAARDLAPAFEKATGHKLVVSFKQGAAMN